MFCERQNVKIPRHSRHLANEGKAHTTATVFSPSSTRSMGLFAFTLVEVMIAMSIFSFALVAIGGLFFVGLNTNKESADQMQAANLASLLISTRRSLPTSPIPNFALPPLNVAYSGSGAAVMGVALDGTVGDGTAAHVPAYNLFYKIGTSTASGPRLAQVHLLLWWPPALQAPANNPATRYELTTQVALP
jgi:prepilin-type N-terminal cleavage/methylation domain-containing protein